MIYSDRSDLGWPNLDSGSLLGPPLTDTINQAFEDRLDGRV